MSSTTTAPPSYRDARPDEEEKKSQFIDDHQPTNVPDPPEEGDDYYDSDSSGYDSPHEYELDDIRNTSSDKGSNKGSPLFSHWRRRSSDDNRVEELREEINLAYARTSFDVEDQMHGDFHDAPLRRRINPIFYKCLIGIAVFSLLVAGSVVMKNKHRTNTEQSLNAENTMIEGVPNSADLATAEQSTPATTKPTGGPTKTPYVPKHNGETDLGQWCGSCAAGPPGVNCDQRVKFLGKHYKTPEQDAKLSLLEEGRCHIKTAVEKAEERPKYPCRNTPEDQGGKEGAEMFCGYCQWQSSDFDCFTRLEYIMNHYHQTELRSMQDMLKGNQCALPDNYTDQFNQEKQDGTEDWCGYCVWDAGHDKHTCETKLAMYTASGEKAELTVKKEILDSGRCKKQPICKSIRGDR